jgi:hypothetical protein
VGNVGEFSIWVGDRKVLDKQHARFPEGKDIVAAVRARQA